MWIFREFEKETSHLPIFCKRFSVGKKIKKCEINLSALGIFNIKVNGKEIEEYFMPGWTNYNKYVHLCSYDLTKLVKKDNLIEITLSDGWYSGRLGYTRESKVYGEAMALYAELILSYRDGTQERIVTDETWKIRESQIVTSSLFDGETVDFRTLKIADYEQLPSAKKFDCEIPFEKYDYEAVGKIREFKPTVLARTENTIRLDFKQNFAGFVTFEAKGEAGTEITIRHAEVLNEDGSLYYDNLRSVKAVDTIILSDAKAKFDPKFTFHGFRYAEITIKGRAKLSNIKGVALSQKIEYFGKFECSDEIVNQIYKNALWGQLSNFISLPTDCPQRDERLGWTGDAQVFCNSAMFNGDCKRFFENYLKLVRTDALPDGKIPSFVPFFIPVSVSTAGVPGWADAICIIPYMHYLHYRDINVIKDNLPYAVKHLEYYLSQCDGYLLKLKNPFGDWLSVEKAEDIDGINQCFLGLSASLISKMYGILGDEVNQQKYLNIYAEAKKVFREQYLYQNGVIAGDSQTIYSFSLLVGYVEACEIKDAFIASLERTNNRLTTGFIGVKYLLPALCQIGEVERAYRMIKETEYPSWGYTVKQGATTIWERWNGYTKENGFETPDMNSFNHYSLGACVEWLYSYILGIKLSEDKTICIAPLFCKELSFARGEYKTNEGKISVEWKRKGSYYILKVRADKKVVHTHDFYGRHVVSYKEQGNGFTVVLL